MINMWKINRADFRRTLYFFKRNGLKNTWYAIRERLSGGQAAPYVYVRPSDEVLERQRAGAAGGVDGQIDGAREEISFSIIVPTYRTDKNHLREMITSVIEQSYPGWELIIADATEDDSVKENVAALLDGRELSGAVRYLRLPGNGGIAENTNQALEHSSGDYVGLLDHDDLLAPDALYEMSECIRKADCEGRELQMLYSDEDKCNVNATEYFEPHFKEKFNLDLILSNNYICHFMVMKRELIQRLRLRKEYEGAQDYDLVLRAVSELGLLRHPERESLVCHLPRILYHWRCHFASTAENPRSKEYAYEAGRKALQDFAERNSLHAQAEHLIHLGFYRLRYQGEGTIAGNMLAARSDIGAVGGCLVRRGRVAGGRMDTEGNLFYGGLSVHAGGYMHRAAIPQDAEAVDIRLIIVREELWDVFREITGVPYQTAAGRAVFAAETLPAGTDVTAVSLELCRAIREKGYRIAYLPDRAYWEDAERKR